MYALYDLNDSLLDDYDYASDPVLQDTLHAWDKMHLGAMESYGRHVGDFGKQMVAHQKRVAEDGAKFLKKLGYSEQAAANFKQAMLFHDIGKTHPQYNPSIWTLIDRPTPEQKAAQKKHARLGAEMFESFAKNYPALLEHPHFMVRHALTLYHHERFDAQGPEGVPAVKLPRFVQVSCIVDAYDGDRIWRPHQPRQRTMEEALKRMEGLDPSGRNDPNSKYIGAFHEGLLDEYTQMKRQDVKDPQQNLSPFSL